MADITNQTITIANAAKLVVFVAGLSGLYYGIKNENQSIRDEIKMMVNDYKAEDRVINLRIENNEKRDDKQDDALRLIVEKMEAIMPERPRLRNR